MNVKEISVTDAAQPASGMPSSEDVRAIGEIIRDTRNLSAEQVAQVLEYQKANDLKFGEAAIALKLATPEDVLYALAQQFNYSVGGEERRRTSPELVSLNQPFSAQAEAFRAIRAQIMLRTTSDKTVSPTARRALAVVSPSTSDGKTYFCANLAIAMSQLGGRTIVVDADLRGPRLHEVFGIEARTGLSGLLTGRRGENVIHPVKGVANLYVLPVGVSPPNPLELIEGPAFGMLLIELLNKFDNVIVDTPAGEFGVDGAIVAARCGSALIVARKHSARVEELRDLTATLMAANSEIVGTVLNEF